MWSARSGQHAPATLRRQSERADEHQAGGGCDGAAAAQSAVLVAG
jgi:hypothetical protein